MGTLGKLSRRKASPLAAKDGPTQTWRTIMTPEQKQFLDALRESGEINMFGAARPLARAFDLTREKATDVLREWMRTFDE